MNRSEDVLKTLKKEFPYLKKRFKIRKIGLFGSFLTGNQRRKSDLDILVVFKEPSFDNYMDLKFFLEKKFQKKVDLVIEDNLKPALQYVKKEALYV